MARLSKKSPSRFWGNAEKKDFTECATINDLTIIRGHETRENEAITVLKGFSTVSAAIEPSLNRVPSLLQLL